MKRNGASAKHSMHLPWRQSRPFIRVETPEQVELYLPLAPFGTRIVAALIDYLILTAVNIVFAALFVILILSMVTFEEPLPVAIAVFAALEFLINMFYFVALELRGGGQTPGKRTVMIRTVMNQGQGLTFGASLLRNLARVVDNLPVLWIVPGLDKGNRRLGDFLAQTFVVLDRKPGKPKLKLDLGDSYIELEDKKFIFTGDILPRLTAEDLNLIEYFFEQSRRGPVKNAERKRVAKEIASRYVNRLELSGQADSVSEQPVRFLEELCLFLRDRYERRGF